MSWDPGQLEALLHQSQGGSVEALGLLFEAFRPYLLSLANHEVDSDLRGKAGASDLVQDTFLEAQRAIRDFRGRTENEFLGWLRRILLNNFANFRRHFRDVSKRDVTREQLIGDHLADGPPSPDGDASPVEEAARREELGRIQSALDQLPGPYREVIVWRNLERQPFREIAHQLDLTEKAAQRLWARAVQELRRRIGQPPT